MRRLILLLALTRCATPGNQLAMQVEFVGRDDLPWAEEIQLCVPKVGNTLKCMSLMTKLDPKNLPEPRGGKK